MCVRKSQTKQVDDIANYYSVDYSKILEEVYKGHYHENGFDYLPTPILTAEEPKNLIFYNWGYIPWWCKTEQDGLQLRAQTLNCISEEMYEKPSFRDSAKAGKRCLIPCTGFFEWRWEKPGNAKSEKTPYYIYLKNQPLFSLGGLYSEYKAPTGNIHRTYTICTTAANTLMADVHNNKKRQPVIIPREYEKDWLNPNLTKDDVSVLCNAIDAEKMDAYTISKLITSKKENPDVPQVLERFNYSPTTLF